jgi:hypothetical protein
MTRAPKSRLGKRRGDLAEAPRLPDAWGRTTARPPIPEESAGADFGVPARQRPYPHSSKLRPLSRDPAEDRFG